MKENKNEREDYNLSTSLHTYEISPYNFSWWLCYIDKVKPTMNKNYTYWAFFFVNVTSFLGKKNGFTIFIFLKKDYSHAALVKMH